MLYFIPIISFSFFALSIKSENTYMAKKIKMEEKVQKNRTKTEVRNECNSSYILRKETRNVRLEISIPIINEIHSCNVWVGSGVCLFGI